MNYFVWVIVLLCLLTTRRSPAADAPVPRSVPSLIEDLHDRDYRVRDAAEVQLRTRIDAIEAIRKESLSPNLDHAERGHRILKHLTSLVAQARMPRIKAFAKSKQFDCLTEACADYPDKGSEEIWQLFLDAGLGVLDTTVLKADPLYKQVGSALPEKSFKNATAGELVIVATDDRDGKLADRDVFFRGRLPTLRVPQGSLARLVVVSGDYSPYWHCGIAFVNGDLRIAPHAMPERRDGKPSAEVGGVVVVDGDITFAPSDVQTDERSLASCVVVARGSITLPKSTLGCLILSGGDIIVPDGASVSAQLHCGGKVIFEGKCREMEYQKRNAKQNDAKALDPFHFFALTDLGLGAKAGTDKSISITDLDTGSPLAKAGIEKGDIVINVDGQVPKTVQELRHLLRTGYVRGDTKLKVLRGRDTKEIGVAFPLSEK